MGDRACRVRNTVMRREFVRGESLSRAHPFWRISYLVCLSPPPRAPAAYVVGRRARDIHARPNKEHAPSCACEYCEKGPPSQGLAVSRSGSPLSHLAPLRPTHMAATRETHAKKTNRHPPPWAPSRGSLSPPGVASTALRAPAILDSRRSRAAAPEAKARAAAVTCATTAARGCPRARAASRHRRAPAPCSMGTRASRTT